MVVGLYGCFLDTAQAAVPVVSWTHLDDGIWLIQRGDASFAATELDAGGAGYGETLGDGSGKGDTTTLQQRKSEMAGSGTLIGGTHHLYN